MGELARIGGLTPTLRPEPVVPLDMRRKSAARLVQQPVWRNNASVEKAVGEALGIRLVVDREMRFPDEGQPYEVVRRVDLPPGLTEERIDSARAVIAAAMSPLPPQDIIKRLARLQLLTVPRKEDTGDTQARAALLAEELAQYPADVVAEVLSGRFVFFPAWEELRRECERRVAPRRGLRASVERYKPQPDHKGT